MQRLFYLFAFTCFMTIGLSAQIYNPVSWESKIEKTGKYSYNLVFEATIEEGWYVYSSQIEDGGPYPLELNFDTEGGFKVSEPFSEKGEMKKEFDPLFDMNVIKYADKLVVSQSISAQSGLESIEGYLTFMTCNDERCLPPTDVDFSFDLE